MKVDKKSAEERLYGLGLTTRTSKGHSQYSKRRFYRLNKKANRAR